MPRSTAVDLTSESTVGSLVRESSNSWSGPATAPLRSRLKQHVATVRDQLDDSVPVHAMLCFVEADSPSSTAPRQRAVRCALAEEALPQKSDRMGPSTKRPSSRCAGPSQRPEAWVNHRGSGPTGGGRTRMELSMHVP